MKLQNYAYSIGVSVIAISLSACTNFTNPTDNPNGTGAVISSSASSEVSSVSSANGYTFESNNVRLTEPAQNAQVNSPVTVSGSARGNWFFEAVLPLEITLLDGTVVTESFVQTEANWMTTDFVPFSTEIEFSVSTPTEALLVVKRSNPSGLPENEDQISIPITLLPNTSANSANQVSSQARYSSKIVYGVSYTNQAELDAWQQDCRQQNGEFNECGTQCAPDAEVCATVCAYVCTLPAR